MIKLFGGELIILTNGLQVWVWPFFRHCVHFTIKISALSVCASTHAVWTQAVIYLNTMGEVVLCDE